MRLLIDGYNLLYKMDCKGRDDLIDRLVRYHSSRGHDISVVFDGTKGGNAKVEHQRTGGIDVYYSSITVTADDTIEELLQHASFRNSVVVSSDRKVQASAVRAGSSFVSSDDFALRLTPRESPASSKKPVAPWEEGREDEDSLYRKEGTSPGGKKKSRASRRRSQTLRKL